MVDYLNDSAEKSVVFSPTFASNTALSLFDLKAAWTI